MEIVTMYNRQTVKERLKHKVNEKKLKQDFTDEIVKYITGRKIPVFPPKMEVDYSFDYEKAAEKLNPRTMPIEQYVATLIMYQQKNLIKFRLGPNNEYILRANDMQNGAFTSALSRLAGYNNFSKEQGMEKFVGSEEKLEKIELAFIELISGLCSNGVDYEEMIYFVRNTNDEIINIYDDFVVDFRTSNIKTFDLVNDVISNSLKSLDKFLANFRYRKVELAIENKPACIYEVIRGQSGGNYRENKRMIFVYFVDKVDPELLSREIGYRGQNKG